MRPELRRMGRRERWGHLLACISPKYHSYPASQADADDIFDTMSDAELRELRDTATRLANAAGNRIINPIQGIDVPTSEEANRAMLRQDALDAIADAWLPPVGETAPQIAKKRVTMREKRNLRSTWPELHNAIAALVGTLR